MGTTNALIDATDQPALDQIAEPLGQADGRVLNGPSTHNQPCLRVRERDGRIEVKAEG